MLSYAGTLTSDNDRAGCGVSHANTLEVEVFNGCVYIVSFDAFNT